MASELEDFLRQAEERQRKDDTEQRMIAQKRHDFNTAFKEALARIIHPTMMHNFEILRGRGYESKMLREKVPMNYYYENYVIHVPAARKHVLVSVFGNYELQKVCITSEFFSNATDGSGSKPVKKNEVQHELADITPALFDTLVLNLLKEMLPAA
jgi:hypothetical protein